MAIEDYIIKYWSFWRVLYLFLLSIIYKEEFFIFFESCKSDLRNTRKSKANERRIVIFLIFICKISFIF